VAAGLLAASIHDRWFWIDDIVGHHPVCGPFRHRLIALGPKLRQPPHRSWQHRTRGARSFAPSVPTGGQLVPKYLIKATYTSDGSRRLLQDGGTKRRSAAEEALKNAGGRLEAFYFALGDTDAFVIVDAPDHVSVSAASLAINASGAVRTQTVVLLTPEEVDQASKKNRSPQAVRR
jgi:uncharacterized protein with GYD domain